MEREQARAAALLDRRTTKLATRPARVSVSAEGYAGQADPPPARPLIIWGLGDSLFGTEVGAIAAVIPFGPCARVPTRELACLGVIGRAGLFYSVIGMRRLLGLGAADARPGHLLLLRGAAPYLAMAVDRVLGRFDASVSDLASGPAISFEGRLVAPFTTVELRDRLGLSTSTAVPSEAMPS
jgi:chemotaxis signal transduction protein